MSGGAGHLADMNNRMRQNRAAKTSNKLKFKGNNRSLNFKSSDSKKRIKVAVSSEELEVIKSRIRNKIGQEQRRNILIVSVILMFLIGLFYVFL